MTYQQFANAVGVSRGAVQQWESGATAPKRTKQPDVARFLGISVSDLMLDTATGINEQKQPPALVQKVPSAIQNAANTANAIDTIAAALALITDDQREAMAGKLAALARAPDSPTLKKSISESLGSTALPPTDST